MLYIFYGMVTLTLPGATNVGIARPQANLERSKIELENCIESV